MYFLGRMSLEEDMKLSEFAKVGKRDSARLLATVTDVTGAKDYE
jgi:hypothetical protein